MSGGRVQTITLRPEQQQALIVKSASVALGSGAGCGKTTVLSERFLNELETSAGRPLRSLVALTFTDKAARELRQRIRDRCRAKIAGGENVGWWSSVLRALEAAPIGTFHEFCARLLRACALEAGIDPEFVIVDAAVAASLRDKAVRSAVRRMLAQRQPELVELGLDYGLRQIREALGTILASGASADLDTWAELEPEELFSRWMQVWNERGTPASLRPILPLARCCRALLERLDATSPELRTRREELLELLGPLAAGECSLRLLDEIRTLTRVDDMRGKSVWPDPEVKEAVKCVFRALRERISKVQSSLETSPALGLESARNSILFVRLAIRARNEYESAKQIRSGLDFDDLLVLTRNLLRDHGELARSSLAVAGSIEFVLVDEFQDTDLIQSEILELLGGSAFQSGRMFVVGDPKQSIYRFRGAEPAIFGQWRSAFPAAGRLSLTENFRSVPGVLLFVNALFADSFAALDAGTLDGSPGQRLLAMRPDQTGESAVTLLWALPAIPADAEPGAKVKTGAQDRRSGEARCLASWLRDRLDRGWTIVDRQTRAPRLAHAGDVAFLFRAMTDVWHYETALADAGFDYLTVGGSAFYAQQEVRDVVNVLSVVEDPLDSVALAGTLRSPFFSLSDDALFWLARTSKGGLAEGLARCGEIPELGDQDRKNAIRACNLLSRWRQFKDRIPLGRLVELVLDESGFEAALACEFLGSRKLANLRKLVRLARDFGRQESFTLADLVARMRADLDNPPSEEQAATSDEESPSIRLMSIHQAKGLEFPIVVIPDLNRKPSASDVLLGLHSELGLVVRPPRRLATPVEGEAGPGSGASVGWLAYRAIEVDEDQREALRLFYVATTRARDHLVLATGLENEPDPDGPGARELGAVGSCCLVNPGCPKPASAALELLLERFDWRTGRCLARLPDGWPVPEVQVVLARPPEPETRRSHPSARQRLLDIERAIVTAAPARQSEPDLDVRLCPALPRRIDLDLQRDSTARWARLGRLVRAALLELCRPGSESAKQVCARLALRQAPAANSALVELAAEWLKSWPATTLFKELRDAAKARKLLSDELPWTLTWPGSPSDATVILGRADAIYRNRLRQWRTVVVSVDPREHQTDRLRLMFAQRAIAHREGCQAAPGWLVWRDEQSTLQVEPQLPAHAETIGRALELWLRNRAGEASAAT
jgi:ATP-dependent helicase/nuclease subunit A